MTRTGAALVLLLGSTCEAQERARSAASLRAESTEIVIPFTPVDKQDRIVTDLHAEDVLLYDDGARRPLTSLVLEDGPASVLFVLDVSGSMKNALGHMREAVESIVRNAPQGDEFGVIAFSTEPEVSVGLTSVESAVSSHLQSLTSQGRTSLVDATMLALQRIKHAQHSRKAIVIITDGQDNHSRHREREAIRTAMETDVRIYSIELYPPVGESYFGKTFLESLAENSGGRYLPTVDARNLADLARRIDAHRFYRATFVPASLGHAGKVHRVEMKLASKDRIRGGKLFWRRGYELQPDRGHSVRH